MSEQVTAAVVEVVRRRHPEATHVAARAVAPQGGGGSGAVRAVEVTWVTGGERHAAWFAAKPARDGAEQRILAALAATPVPAPRLVDTGADESVLVMEHLPGRPADEALRGAGMRWEVSALAFTVARALVEVHALKWEQVAPWLADPEALPEDIVDDQVDARWEDWEARIDALPADARRPFAAALTWLDLRRPVEVSVCLCHGDFRLANVLLVDDEVSGLVGWSAARVADAAEDVAALSIDLGGLGLPGDTAELFMQAFLGAYLQSSPRYLSNLPFYTVAGLLDRALAAAESGDPSAPAALAAMQRTMADGGQVPWRTGGQNGG